MKFPIKNRFTDETIIEVDLDASYEKEPSSVKLGEAVKVAVVQKANLAHAKLYGADLTGAKLTGANLYGADLCGANLRGADLCGANLYGANLRGADLCGANLYAADLRGADLCGADLCGANLYGANLRGADLTDANLTDANLYGANLYGADLRDANLTGANLQGQSILQIDGLHWPVLITPEYLQIGCEKHPHEDWRSFDDRRIAEMDGKEALKFWKENKDWLLARCDWAAGFQKKDDAA